MVPTVKVKNTEKDDSNGATAVFSLATSMKIILKDLAFMNGTMAVNLKANGRIIKCMAKGNSLGLMEGFIRASIFVIKIYYFFLCIGDAKNTLRKPVGLFLRRTSSFHNTFLT